MKTLYWMTKKYLIIFSIVLFSIVYTEQLEAKNKETSFLKNQLSYSRVQDAFIHAMPNVQKKLDSLKIKKDNLHILFVTYKDSNELELYVKDKNFDSYNLASTYSICARSGILGPKNKQGDGQVPEGFYSIDRYNPSSSYHLSLGINYPNDSDKKRSREKNLGGDIFIHGSCVTIGCLPMTDDIIKELYLWAIYARNNGQKIPVYIFPFRMTSENMEKYSKQYKEQKDLVHFWENLRHGYEIFISTKKELNFNVDKSGMYLYRS